VRLIDGPRDRQLWAESYERKIQDVIQLQREVARDITTKIQLRLSSAQSARLAARAVVDPEAYELYLRGRFEWSRMTDASVRQAIRYYEQAIVRNPNDARPDAGIAYAYLVLAHIVRTMSCLEALPKAREHAEKALALDSASAEAQTAMAGSLVFYEHEWVEAERRTRLATQLNSGYPGGHLVYAILLGAEGRYQEGLVHSNRAIELDPRFLIYSYNRAWQSYLMHQFDQASLQVSKTLDIEPRFPPAIELQVRIQESRGNYREAIRRWRSMEALGMPAAVGDALDQSYLVAGAHGYWQAQLKIARRRQIGLRHSNTWIASVYSALGERDSAFAALDRAYAALESDLIFCRADPALDGLRDDPRMAAFIRRMGLTP
jgi:tetratricopeptide (TPR) repeat protein